MKDYYSILETTPDASPEVIKAAYRALAKKYHPDSSNIPAYYEQKMRDINEAYDVLSNERSRMTYDFSRRNYSNSSFSHEESTHFDSNKDDTMNPSKDDDSNKDNTIKSAEEDNSNRDDTINSMEKDLYASSEPVPKSNLKKPKDNPAEVMFVAIAGMALFIFLITLLLTHI